jgi:short-subunit dehydrogenase
LSPQRVFVTGASSGLGAALALLYAGRGARLGLVARRMEGLRSLAAVLPGEHRLYAADVSDLAAMTAVGADYIAREGLPDLVIANAGISVGTLTEHAEDYAVFSAVLQTNVLGLVATFHPFVAAMREARRGTLAGIASVSGARGLAGAGAYCASKSALITYLESLRVELRGSGVRVVTVSPGFIATRMTSVNPYRMPFILSADEAARRIARVIGRGKSFAIVPWQMAIVARLLRLAPNWLFDRYAAKARRKPRGLPQ